MDKLKYLLFIVLDDVMFGTKTYKRNEIIRGWVKQGHIFCYLENNKESKVVGQVVDESVVLQNHFIGKIINLADNTSKYDISVISDYLAHTKTLCGEIPDVVMEKLYDKHGHKFNPRHTMSTDMVKIRETYGNNPVVGRIINSINKRIDPITKKGEEEHLTPLDAF